MTLLDRIARDTSLTSDEKIPGHKIENVLKLYFHDLITKDDVTTMLNISEKDMSDDLDLFKVKYDDLKKIDSLEAEKWLMDLEACVILLQQRDFDKTVFNIYLGLTLKEG